MHNEKLTLATLCGGAVQEKVDRALEKVARNILDPNTDPGKKRSVTLKLELKPNENDKEDVEVTANVSYSIAPELGVSTRFFVNKDIKRDTVSVMEHKKGEIKGQLDFSDIGLLDSPVGGETRNTVTADADTDETSDESDAVGKIIDLRRAK